MPYYLNTEKLAKLIEEKLGGCSLREAVKGIEGISLATLSRIKRGNPPDLMTFLFICEWLEVDPNSLIEGGKKKLNTCDLICRQLKTDTSLNKETKQALITLIQLAYKR